MGGAASAPKKVQHKLKKSEEEVIRLMLPVFYNSTPIDAKERKMAMDSWNLILDDQSPIFRERKGKPDFPYQSCVTFFYDSFYTRLFDIHPTCRHMFKSGMRAQGKFLVKMISLALSELDDPEQFDKNLVKLAEIHYERGVKSVEYGVVGEVLFFVLRQCLGPNVYLQSIHSVWVKVYSRMLRTIVPIAVALELKGNRTAAQTGEKKERPAIRASYMFSQAQTMAFSQAAELAEEADKDEMVELKSEKIRTGEITKVQGSTKNKAA